MWLAESSTSQCRQTLSLSSEAQAGAFSRPPEEMLSGETLSHPMVPVLAVSSPTLLPQPSEPPPIQELPGRGLWSACTQEWIAGIEGHVFLASIMARGRHPHSGWRAALRWSAWILLAGLREQREVLRSVQHCCHLQPKHPS